MTTRQTPTDARVDAIVSVANDPDRLRGAAIIALAMERYDALTQAAEMLDRAQQPAAALGLIIMRDKR